MTMLDSLAKSPVVRKGGALLRQVPRRIRRFSATADDYKRRPPVLVNSLPKSGTHLLLQIARALPETDYFGSFIAQRPSTSTRVRSDAEIERMIDRITPGEVVPAHVHFSERTAASLKQRNVLHLFIHRDPAAVILSEVAYLSDMARWNALHARFAALKTIQERIDLAIDGDGSPEYPDAAARFAPFLDWCARDDVVSLRYEDLMNPETRPAELRRIAECHGNRAGLNADTDLISVMDNAIMPQKSHTYREKSAKSQRPEFTEFQRDRFLKMFEHVRYDW